MKTHVKIRYTNHRGETADRVIEPGDLFFGKSEWHPGRQWLLQAWDFGKGQLRTFAMKDVSAWEPVGEGGEHADGG